MLIQFSQSIIVNLWQTEFSVQEFQDYSMANNEGNGKENTEIPMPMI